MVEKDLQLGVAIHQPTKSMLELMEDNLETTTIDDGRAFGYNNEDNDVYEELADASVADDAVNTTMSLGIYSPHDSMFYPSELLTQELAKQSDMDSQKITLDIFPDIEIDEFNDKIQKECQRINDEYYGGMSDLTPRKENVEQSERENEEKTIEENTEKEETKESSVETSKKETEPELDSKNIEEARESENMLPQEDEDLNDVEPDPLLTLAKERVENSRNFELPMYDSIIMKQLLPTLVKSETDYDNIKRDVIYDIYDLLQDERPKFEHEFDEKFKKSEEDHQSTIQTLLDNQKIEIEKLLEEEKKKYENDREEYVTAQKPLLMAQYDKENKAIFDDNLNHKKDKINDKYQAQIDEENERYENYRAAQEDEYLENQFNKIDISKYIKKLEEENERQTSIIEHEATQFGDQVANVTKNAIDERDKWKNKYEGIQKEIDTLKDTFNQRLETEVREQVHDKTADFKERMNNLTSSETQAREELHQMSSRHAAEIEAKAHEHNAEMRKLKQEAENDKQDALDKQKSKFNLEINDLKETNKNLCDKKDNQIKELKNKLKDAEEERALQQSLIKQMQEHETKIQAKQETISATPITEKPKEIVKTQKTSKGMKWLIGGLTTIALLGSGSALYMAGKAQQVQDSPTITDNVSSASQVSEKPTSSAVSAYSKGQKVQYHDPKTNKDYEVTIDSTSGDMATGHYVDNNGVNHTVTYQN